MWARWKVIPSVGQEICVVMLLFRNDLPFSSHPTLRLSYARQTLPPAGFFIPSSKTGPSARARIQSPANRAPRNIPAPAEIA